MTHARMPLTRRVHAGAALIALVTVTSGAVATGANAAAAAPPESPLRAAVVLTVNHVRAQHGCKPLTVRKQLNKAAQGHADDMARTGLFSHTSADGRSWIARIRNAGWSRPGGENIAAGFSTPGTVMTAWMNSPEHRRNILDCSFRHIGVGYSATGGYWVQDFGY